ncbi:MAG: MFS transporter, partial [Candidatus Aquilonibacter sp.]
VMVVSLCAFVYWELAGTKTPIVDLRVLRNRSVAAGSILGLALGTAIFGSTYILPQFTQGPLGFTPTLSGLLFILRALPIMFMTPLIVRFVGRIDPRVMLGAGFILVSFGSWLQATVTNGLANFWSFAPALIITGVGSALLFIPLSIAVLGATTPEEGPKAAAFINLSLQLGGSISVAALDVIIDRRWSFHSSVLGGDVTLASPAVHAFLQHGGTAGQLAQVVNAQAAILAYADATMVIAVVCVLCSPLVLFMRRRSPSVAPAGAPPGAPSAAEAAVHA